MLEGIYDVYTEAVLPLTAVHLKLAVYNLNIEKARKILGVTRKQLIYWDDLRKSKPDDVKHRAQRRYCVYDLFWFGLMKNLREVGIPLNQYVSNFKKLLPRPGIVTHLFYHFAEGNPIFCVLSIADKQVQNFVGSKINLLDEKIKEMKGPIVILPLNNIYIDILKKVTDEDFRVKLVKDDFGKKNKVIFYISMKSLSNQIYPDSYEPKIVEIEGVQYWELELMESSKVEAIDEVVRMQLQKTIDRKHKKKS